MTFLQLFAAILLTTDAVTQIPDAAMAGVMLVFNALVAVYNAGAWAGVLSRSHRLLSSLASGWLVRSVGWLGGVGLGRATTRVRRGGGGSA